MCFLMVYGKNEIDSVLHLMLLWWIKFKSGQGDEAADSTDRQRRTGLNLIHYIMQRAMWIVPQYKGRLKCQTAFQTTF